MEPSRGGGHSVLRAGGVVVVSKLAAVIEKKAAKLSRSCHINKSWCRSMRQGDNSSRASAN